MIQQIFQNPGKLQFQIRKVFQKFRPFDKEMILLKAAQQNLEDTIDKVNIIQGFFKKKLWISIKGDDVLNHPEPHHENKEAVLEIDTLVHGYIIIDKMGLFHDVP